MMKIAEMYRRSNGTHGDKRCRDCPNLITVTDGKLKKIHCRLYADSEEKQTDWSGQYPACAWFGKQPEKQKAKTRDREEEKGKTHVNSQISLSDLFPELVEEGREG